ncbi:translation factor GTPase family protein [Lachnobacterium bovis]|uniref:translation factor GTPase family protein n=1 Tax=Lachnobacterium bovis TaxID=140626 RepID=UPI00048E9EBA|nr:TetM/TetW/TetO/TetS family tetracycline resistance ribosomal protection protein [Lachnobacterium bovis]
MKRINIGILAHVDAGKTTLSEALLYKTGQIRKLGRVDHKDAFLDTDSMEKDRGITIFSKQAKIKTKEMDITLLDTPGHVDFSAEMERTLEVLDYAILVISGTDKIQSHTRTVWKLLKHYNVPTFIFVNKMDLVGANKEEVLSELKGGLSNECVDFSVLFDNDGAKSDKKNEWEEEIAVSDESLLEKYMETGALEEKDISKVVSQRKVFPCIFGSALNLEGVEELFSIIEKYTSCPKYGDEFGARIYKIGHDVSGKRLTFLKVTGGTIKVKDLIEYTDNRRSENESDDTENTIAEKIDQIRIYSGEKFEAVDEVCAGTVCAVVGLTKTQAGMGLGFENNERETILEPVLNYQIFFPDNITKNQMLQNLRVLEEEDPKLNVVWNEELKEIHVQLMGPVQIEVLTHLIKERFDISVSFGEGSIVYKETVAKPIEGVGHFEPLRHYAEVHLLIEPGERGSGVTVASSCSTDILDLNWQRLITTHIEEKEHKGVLTGSGLTDVKITILTGRAHQKHTEGGDFRQATYRAIRNGLMKAKNLLLEPYFSFEIEVPKENIGRALSDMEQNFAKYNSPEFIQINGEEWTRLTGKVPVSTVTNYKSVLNEYTSGRGRISLNLEGYDICHNPQEVIAERAYNPEMDLRNTADSVFCAHGAGFVVPWAEVENYMHLDYVYQGGELNYSGYGDELENFDLQAFTALSKRKEEEKRKFEKMNSYEVDAQLQSIYQREFGMNKDDMLDYERKKWMKKNKSDDNKVSTVKVKKDRHGNPIYKKNKEQILIVDGYNIIFGWPDLYELANTNMDSARDKLLDELANYQGFKHCEIIVVFDAYKNKNNPGKHNMYHNINVVYTKEDEKADTYIERKVNELKDKYNITVASSDGLVQLTTMKFGALRLSARLLKEEIEAVCCNGMEQYRGSSNE